MTVARRNLIALSGLGAIGAPLRLDAQTPTRPDLVIAVQDNPPQLDPLRLTLNVAFRVLHNVFDHLIRTEYGPDGQLHFRSGLAESWRRLDDRTLELRLRRDVRFHDGMPMTAEDVAFTFGEARMRTPSAPGFGIARQFFGGLEGVEVVDPATVRVVARGPDPLLEFRLAGWGGQVIGRRAFEAAGDWDRFALAPVGTGPYRVAEARTGEHILLASHDPYWGGRPPYRSLRFRVVPEAAARVAALLSGGVALATEISPDQIAEIERRPGFEVTGGAIANHRVLNFDTLNGPLRDVRLRRALSLAIDRDLIARSFFADRVTVPQGHQWSAYGDLFIADWPKPAFDPGRARSLLREAGYGGSVIPYRTTNQYYTAEMATAQILREMWAAVGLNVELRVVENWTQVFARPVGGVFNGSINMVYPDLMGSLWPLYGPDGFIRRTTATWDNVEFAEIGARLSALMDRQARHAAHRRVLEIFTEVDPPGTVLHATPMFYGKRRDLRWQPYPVAQMDFGPFNPALSA